MEYNLSYEEAFKACLFENYFIIGEEFEKGVYGVNKKGTLMVEQIKEDDSFPVLLWPMPITTGILTQKYRKESIMNKKVLYENKK